ncbi:hypothetical protein DFJ74DRAFT_120331 [Hyaloraphidium curvatum]|nr:hypothetical protein DFJ74DRAFT_120331 [Hyaloraphidium curvatum]
MSLSSATSTILPVLGCLRAAEEWLGRPQNWSAVTDTQRAFLARYRTRLVDVDAMGSQLERQAAARAAEVNAWLASKGWPDVKLDETGPGGFAVASVMDVLVEWTKAGLKTSIRANENSFPGVQQANGVEAFQAEGHPHPVVKLTTKSKDVVYMSVAGDLAEKAAGGHLGMPDALDSIKALPRKSMAVSGVIFPCITYSGGENLDFLVGLRTSPDADHYEVSQAVQKTKFRMNEIGARAQSAAAMGMKRSRPAITKPWITIDRPFFCWIERDGVGVPIFAGFFAEDSWKDPGSLL